MKQISPDLPKLALIALAMMSLPAMGQSDKPNILIIWGDDIGQFNVSAYNMGMMGYRTPNIDRIADEGAMLYRLVHALSYSVKLFRLSRVDSKEASHAASVP